MYYGCSGSGSPTVVLDAGSPDTIERIGAAEARRNRPTAVALWVIAALLVAITWMLV